MNKILTSVAAISMLVSGDNALGRVAVVQSYSSGDSKDFTIIEPGAVAKPTADEAPPGEGRQNLQADFEAFESAKGAGEAKLAVSIDVPAWMRGSDYSFVRRAGQGDCAYVPYRPHSSLRPDQEIRRRRYYDAMVDAACNAGIPVPLFDALIIQESRYNPAARSIKGASGLAQLMPATASNLGVQDRWDVRQNLAGGARYLRQQLDMFGNWALALSAYNAGPGNVQKHKGIPPFRETRGYVKSILASINSQQVFPTTDMTQRNDVKDRISLLSFSR